MNKIYRANFLNIPPLYLHLNLHIVRVVMKFSTIEHVPPFHAKTLSKNLTQYHLISCPNTIMISPVYCGISFTYPAG